ncbi:VgrG-related protein [Embleya sp. NPDC059259]|uniref:VgrG-related protein n=1 Tax=unclassified Embleya TaxID=2699296 RepID=UPI0036BF12BC
MTSVHERALAAQPVVTFLNPLTETWNEQLLDVRVDTAVDGPAHAEVRLRDERHTALSDLDLKFGHPLTIAVAALNLRTRRTLFTGEIVALETDIDSAGSFVAVLGMSRDHRLRRGRRVDVYPQMTTVEIVRRIAERNGLVPGAVEDDPADPPPAYLAQPNLSDWEFLADFARQRSLVPTVEDTALCLRRRPVEHTGPHDGEGPVELRYGANLLNLRARLSSLDQVEAVEVRGWNPARKEAVTATAPATATATYAIGATPDDLVQPFNTSGEHGPNLLVASVPYTTKEQVTAAAVAVAADTTAAMADVDAHTFGTPRLRAGDTVEVTGITAPFAGAYTISTCTHHFGASGYTTHVRMGPPPPPVVPPPSPLTGPGVAVGIVTHTRQPEDGEYGEVRVKLPWLSDTYVTDWIRTLQWGGAGGGGVFTPEIHDEVLVCFEHGRLDKVFVMGGLYNGLDTPTARDDDPPRVDADGTIVRRSLASRTGEQLEFLNDPNGSQGLRLTTGDGNVTANLDRAAATFTLTARPRSGNGQGVRVTLDGDKGTLDLDAGQGRLVLRGGRVTIEATTGDIDITSPKGLVTLTGKSPTAD